MVVTFACIMFAGYLCFREVAIGDYGVFYVVYPSMTTAFSNDQGALRIHDTNNFLLSESKSAHIQHRFPALRASPTTHHSGSVCNPTPTPSLSGSRVHHELRIFFLSTKARPFSPINS